MTDDKKIDNQLPSSVSVGVKPRITWIDGLTNRWRGALARHPRTDVFHRGGLLIIALVLAALAGFGGGLLANHQNDNLGTSLSDQKRIVSNQGELISQISKTVGPSVVSINTSTTTGSTDNFGFSGGDQTQKAAGTGMIISKNGVILTNRHVVPSGTTSVSVTLSDGTTFDNVTVLGRTNNSDSLDVAFLKINDLKGKALTPVSVGDSGQAAVGDSVVAIGNALGEFQNTVTSGIISGFGRQVQAGSDGGNFGSSGDSEDLDDLIQTDAAINEGNSGGPLVNLNGQVIGINTAIASNAQNIGFAIPINDVKGLITQVLNSGKFQRPYLGVRYVQLTSDIAQQYGISEDHGAYVIPEAISGEAPIVAGSPAEKSGLQAGDIITKVNGDSTSKDQSLTTLLNKHQPGDSVKLTVVRGGKTLTITATLGSMPTN
jgi:S1-C subfamily serine protease